MILKDISFQTPEENIIFDEVLLSLAENGFSGEVLRFWEPQEPFIVLGKICREEDDLFVENIQKDGLKVLRRASGGGTVLEHAGCLNYSLVLSKEQNPSLVNLNQSYKFILSKIIDGLNTFGVETVFMPICDIALFSSHKKISGNAQKRGKKFILHHGTILYDFDIEKIGRYLRMPKQVPEYRKGRSHRDFVANVPVAVGDLKLSIKNVFAIQQEESFLKKIEAETLREYLRTKSPVVHLEKFAYAS
ncbi:MAG: lipoate--protein ligase family protein [Candidatus Omnitrophica bacterium]|nr:lipoate--protein ligase family protein [Candidatus Omnitrophota bacterium]